MACHGVSIERAAYARLLRDCRSMRRALRDGAEEAAAAGDAYKASGGGGGGGGGGFSRGSGDSVSELVSAASAAAALARQAEAEAIELLQRTAREEARRLPKEMPPARSGGPRLARV